jgi:hypothetical protein
MGVLCDIAPADSYDLAIVQELSRDIKSSLVVLALRSIVQ